MPRLSCSSEDGTGSAGQTISYSLGEVARLLDVPVDRVERWVRNHWLVATGGGQGRGRPRAFTQTELDVARRALRIAQRYAVTATEAIFTEARRRHTREE